MLWLSIILTILLISSIYLGIVFFLKKKGVFKSYNPIKWIKFTPQHIRLKKLGAVLLILIVISGTFNVSTRLAFMRTTINGYAEWRYSNGQKYLYVEAEDRYSLGYLEGKYLASQIVNFKVASGISALYYSSHIFRVIEEAKKYLQYIPPEYIEEMRGMADGASQGSGWIVTFEDILLQNVFLDAMYGHIIPDYYMGLSMGCTSIGARNNDGTIMISQNFDFPHIIGRKGPLPSLAFVHSKLTGVAEIFGLRLGAFLSLPIARTSNGLTMIITVIETNITSDYAKPSTVVIRQALETMKDIEEGIDFFFNQNYLTCGFSSIVTNQTHILGIQGHPLEYRLNYNDSMAYTNRFVYQDWNELYFPDGDFSLTRQQYVTRLVDEKYNPDNILTHEELIEILGTTIDGPEGPHSAPCYDNGLFDDASLAVFTNNSFAIGTIYDGLGVIPI